MATRQEERMIEPEMNPQDLWLEEIFTDRRVGTIRRMTPVDGTGESGAGTKNTGCGAMVILRSSPRGRGPRFRKSWLPAFAEMSEISIQTRRRWALP